MKHLYIELEVQDGERRHTHRVLHNTNAENILFAAEWYVSHFWGNGRSDGRPFNNEWWWFCGEYAARLVRVVEVPPDDHKVLRKYMYG